MIDNKTPSPRMDAAKKGETRYTSSYPCKKCSGVERYTSYGNCVTCAYERAKKRHAKIRNTLKEQKEINRNEV